MSGARVAMFAAAVVWPAVLLVTLRAGQVQSPRSVGQPRSPRTDVHADVSMFAPSSECLACHNNLVTPAGEDVSIGRAGADR